MAAVRRRIKVPQGAPVEVKRAIENIDRAFADFTLETRTLNTTAPLAGGGNLTADRTFTLGYDSTLVLSGANLSRAALTGDIVVAAGSNVTALSAALNALIYQITLSVQIKSGNNIDTIITVFGADGATLLSQAFLMECWLSDSATGWETGTAPDTAFAVNGTGTAADVPTASKRLRVITNGSGQANLRVTHAGAAHTWYLRAVINGRIFTSSALVF